MTGPLDLVVAILTFRRPDDLAAALPPVLAQAAEVAGRPDTGTVAVLVVDNDPEATGRTVVAAHPAAALRYVVEPAPGISAARNRALDEAADADLLVFLDDDEVPHDGWLAGLLDARAATGAAGVAGPVVSAFAGPLDPWIAAGGFFQRRRPASGTLVETAATNNLLLDLRVVRRRGLRFDPRLGLSGGEDTAFTRTLTRGGDPIVWCAEAVVTDHVPPSRMTREWVLARARRSGASSAAVDVGLAVGPAARLSARGRGLAGAAPRLLGGLARAGLGTLARSAEHQARGLRTAARGWGMLRGALGQVEEEYRRPDAAPARSLVVLQSFPTPTAASNPYVAMLRNALAGTDGVRVETFSWRTALTGAYDVFHAHWPETLVERRRAVKTAVRRALALAFLVRLRTRRVAVVRTVHNLEVPQGLSAFERAFLRRLDRLTVLRIVLTPRTLPSVSGPTELVLHGDYRGWFTDHPRQPAVRGRLVFAGLVRRYKNVDGLLTAFASVSDPELRLRVAGSPSPGLAEPLQALADADPRVSLALRRLTDAELVAEITAAELVVLPYRHMHNSGAVLAALSLDRPVLVPDTPANRDLAAEVGSGWVWTFTGDLDGADLAGTVAALRADPPAGPPRLAARDWETAGPAHRAAYRRAVGLRARRPG